MKKKKDLSQNMKKFSSRAKAGKIGRRDRNCAAKAALQRAVAEAGYGAAKVRVRHDGGRSARQGGARRDEERAVGLLSVSSGGFGFVRPDDPGARLSREIFLPPSAIGAAMSGDTVEVAYRVFRGYAGEERTEGRILRILSYGKEEIYGTLVSERVKYRGAKQERFFVIPDDPALHLRPYVRDPDGAREGDKVRVALLREKGGARYMECEIREDYGPAFTKEANYRAILDECAIPTEFTPEQIAAADAAAKEPIREDGRVLRRETVMTIDGAGAKDLDDAISVERLPGGRWKLGVHIADVSHYVKEKSSLERLAMQRGNSVYFTDKVVPMLPESLSNGACSLNPGEQKYTLSAMITLAPDGEIAKLSLEPSIIVSRVRGVYGEVNELLGGCAEPAVKEKYKPVLPLLLRAEELYRVLKKKSEARGALEMEGDDVEIALGEDGLPTDIRRVERGTAERMIEQFMLCANEAVAAFLHARKIPCVYRVHADPPEDKREDFCRYVGNLGLHMPRREDGEVRPEDYAKLLADAEERGLLRQVSYAMLRSMAKAVYSDLCEGHFGLALEDYCHFTSPIRRLSDLATHRVIHKVLLEGKKPEAYASFVRRAAAAATEGEQRAVTAERRIDALYKALYLSERIGKEYPAVVSSVTPFGAFCELENGCEGLIPLSSLPGAPVYDEATAGLRAYRLQLHIGDGIVIRVAEADILRGKVRFDLVSPADAKSFRQGKRAE